MKKKIASMCLIVCMALTMLPTQAFAATPQKLATPTEIQWNRHYGGKDSYDERIGFISWKIPEDGIVADEYLINIYKNDETKVKDTTYVFDDFEKEMRCGSLHGLNTLELSDGTYYFTVQAIGDGTNYTSSDVSSKSPDFTYTKPSTQVTPPSNLVWSEGKISFSPPSDPENVLGYEIQFYFGKTENSISETNFSSLVSNYGASATEESISDLDMLKQHVDSGESFCRFRVRALSSDINKNQNSDWSAYSPVKDLSDLFSGTNTFTLSYALDGGTGTGFDSQTYQAGTKVTLPAAAPTKAGYTFKGWSDGSNTYQAAASFTMPEKAVTLTAQWSKDPVSISSATVAVAGSHTYTGSAITPEVTVTVGGTTLNKGSDYTVKYNNNINVGTATVTVTGKGEYTGTASTTFAINKADLPLTADTFLVKEQDATASIDLSKIPGLPSGTKSFAVTDGQKLNGFTTSLSGSTLTLTSTGNGTSAEACTITGTHDNYTVTITIQVTYTEKPIKTITAPAVTASVVYNGNPAVIYSGTPTITGEEAAEFTVTYEGTGNTSYHSNTTAPTNAGTYKVTFALKDESGTLNYVANPVAEEFTITQATPSFTAPTAETLSAPKPLGEVALTGGAVKGVNDTDIAGTFSWAGDGTADVVRGQGYSWTFTPTADDPNYDFTKVTGQLTPWAASSGGGNGGGGGGGSVTPPTGPSEPSEPEEPTDPVLPPDPAPSFTDVPRDAYYSAAVDWAISKGITTGTGNGQFSPNASCTRGEMVTFLWRAAGSPAPSGGGSFTDVPADAYYHDAVLWAAQQGITTGTGAGIFDPNATVTRAQTVTFLYRFAGSPDISGGSSFGDVASGTYYSDAVAWAVANFITTGNGENTFGPADDCTRAQIVTFLFRQLAE